VLQRKKALSSLTLDDALAYRDFLADSQPAAQWIGSKSRTALCAAVASIRQAVEDLVPETVTCDPARPV
jgi:hypothetical protein